MKLSSPHIFRNPLALLAASVFVYLFSFLFTSDYTQQASLKRESAKQEEYLKKYQHDFLSLTDDSVLVSKLAAHLETLEEFTALEKKPYGIFLYRQNIHGNELLFWGSQMVTPAGNDHSLPEGEYFQKLSNGYYLCVKKMVEVAGQTDKLEAFAMIPVQHAYFVETNYLPNDFLYNKKIGRSIKISSEITNYPVKSVSGKILYYLERKNVINVKHTTGVVIWFRLISMVLLLLFLYFAAEQYSSKRGVLYGIGFLFITLFVLRVISYYFPFPLPLRQFGLFDPQVYGSTSIHKSLGDLLINAALACLLALFAGSKLGIGKHEVSYMPRKIPVWQGVAAAMLLVLLTFVSANIIRSLAADSVISFDVTDFDSLTIYSVLGFLALSLVAVAYYYFTRILSELVTAAFPSSSFISYFIIAVTGLTYLSFTFGSPLVRFFIFALIWLLAYTWLLQHPGFFINRLRFNVASTIFWIFIFSVTISAIIIEANRSKEWEIRKRIAEKLDEQTDPYNEKQLSIAFAYLDRDFLEANFDRFYDEDTNKQLRDSILSERGYLNRYDTKIYLFDRQGHGLFNSDAESFNALNTVLMVQGKKTGTADLYYHETSFDKFTFILKRIVTDSTGKLVGSLFVVSKPKNYNTDALYPELFRQASQNNPEESPIYSYAVYKKNTLISLFNKYPFPISLQDNQLSFGEFAKKVNGDYDELWYKASGEKVVVIAKKRSSVIEAITLFSYVFCSFLFLVAILGIGGLLLKSMYDISQIRKMLQLNIRVQVHSTIIFISLLSFVIIGFATISFFKTRYTSSNVEKLSRTMNIMVREMQKKLDERGMFDDVLPIYDSVANAGVQNLVNEVAEIHNVDVNVYDTKGSLQVSSQPIIYNEGFLSFKMQPMAFYHLNRMRQVQFVQKENIAGFTYQSIYAPVRENSTGKVKLYLNIPYFLSQSELNQEISNFLVTIINLNAFIFLIAGVIALFITNRITRSFSIISEKMQEVNLGKANEEIEWNRNDEIGELVKEYNKMVNKLEASAAALARSEREGAWREMARQVAHEIKNPLTPMKLSIQYLQKSIDNNSGDVKQLTANVAKTLVEQIDHLSKIAFDFSQFANIGNTNIETFDINDVLRSLGDLYSTNDDVDLALSMTDEEVMIKADKTQMNRLFTNLIQNAVEAFNGTQKCRIELSELRVDRIVRISVRDYGEGIPAEMQSKIFIPNFTTKTSGTGLGLAMCKGIVEQAGGKIWFDTRMGEGTVFYVELPVMN